MADALTGTTQVTLTGASGWIEKSILEIPRSKLLHTRFGKPVTVPKGSGKSANLRRYNKLAVPSISGLTEGVAPDSVAMSVSDYAATLVQVGNLVKVTDVAEQTAQWDVIEAAGEVLAINASETIDKIAREILVAGTNVIYANGAASRAALAGATVNGDWRKAKALLSGNDGVPLTGFVPAGTGVGTAPKAPAFVGIVHADMTKDLSGLTDWKSVETYSSLAGLLEGEVGSMGSGIRLCESSLAKNDFVRTTAVAGFQTINAGADARVYAVPIMAANAYATVDFSGVVPVDKLEGSLNQLRVLGWKWMYQAIRINENWLVRIESLATV